MVTTILLVIHTLAALLLMSAVLIQRSSADGLSGAFGAGGGGDTFFGARSGDFLTRATGVCAVVFMITSLSLAVLSAKQSSSVMRGKAPSPAGETKIPAGAKAPEVYEKAKGLLKQITGTSQEESSATLPGAAGTVTESVSEIPDAGAQESTVSETGADLVEEVSTSEHAREIDVAETGSGESLPVGSSGGLDDGIVVHEEPGVE